ncbi:response regulator [Sphingobacterium sp. UBA5670]|uniref:response regulator n=1 Tax=Sphingobacterium sp. UBA5670 TaxID=1947502 RepID=UPI0026010A52|nr:response regulator [Sphingobacterium sp. UBA5670]
MPKRFLRDLQIGFGVSLVLLLASSTASYLSIRNQIHNSEMVDHSRRVISKANNILIDLQNAETGQRGFLLTGREHFLQPFYTSTRSLPQSIASAKELVSDNVTQKRIIDSVGLLVESRLNKLIGLVNLKNSQGTITLKDMEEGKKYMDVCRGLIATFVDNEEKLLNSRSGRLNAASTLTSLFVIIAAIVSLFITIVSYIRLRGDLAKRVLLEEDLRKKDGEIKQRLITTQRIAGQIAAGNYEVKINDQEHDELGSLAGSLNHMAASLKKSFDELSNNEWRQTGLALLNDVLVGNRLQEDLAKEALQTLINYTDCANGSLYLVQQEKLVLIGAYGQETSMPESIDFGQGAIGQVFLNGKERILENPDPAENIVSFASGHFPLRNILLLPIFDERTCIGVMELGSFANFEALQLPYYKEASRHIGAAIVAAQARQKVQLLLEETQTQTEELQAQHAELENLNANLEIHTQKLQTSEEELRVQQEELLQANKELEERSALLEEKNLLIADRNHEIQKKAEELTRSTRYKSEFLANMSHELRTPLNSILLLSRLMSDNPEKNLTTEQIESAEVIQLSGQNLLTLIDEILDLSKIESGKMDLDYQNIVMADLVRDLNNLFSPIVQEKALSFTIKLADDLPPIIKSDRQRLEQILRNLLSNAIKFTSIGQVTLAISHTVQDAGNISFAVTDTGIGIPADKQGVIFEAFQQADGSTRRKFGGTGLGLSISRELARLLGGEIRLNSQERKGSTFTLILPLDPTNHENMPQTTGELIQSISESIEGTQEIILSNNPHITDIIPADVDDDRNNITEGDKVILIVEDDVNFAKALLRYTRQQSYKGIVIVRGDQATNAALRYKPTAILLDIQLPVKDGWQVMVEIKGNPITRHIPVHIMSSFEVKRESLLQGAIDFIDKPVALEQMAQMFRKIEEALARNPKKVLIVEENSKHAAALSNFLGSYDIISDIKTSIADSIESLSSHGADCVILDMGVPGSRGYETLDSIRQKPSLENIPIIVFTGKNLSKSEELKLKQYADSIVIKTANSYQRILDEVGLFLHLVGNNPEAGNSKSLSLGTMKEVLKDKKVLIADDDIRTIYYLSQALERHHINVISATDGKEALEKIEEHDDISIILMDMMMPEMDGYETIKMIRQNPDYSSIPIIAITAKNMMGDREACLVAGASDYISKPVDTDQLLSLLRVWLYNN